jgi:hypothetical protein
VSVIVIGVAWIISVVVDILSDVVEVLEETINTLTIIGGVIFNIALLVTLCVLDSEIDGVASAGI